MKLSKKCSLKMTSDMDLPFSSFSLSVLWVTLSHMRTKVWRMVYLRDCLNARTRSMNLAISSGWALNDLAMG